MSKSDVQIPARGTTATLKLGRREVKLTNLPKVFFPEAGFTKRDLLTYYASIADVLVPHLRDRAMVMKRYPNGVDGKFFFAKRTPAGAPVWLSKCLIEHASGNVIDFPMTQDAATLLWLINLGCIDLNPWYSRCDDINRPDYLNFDLDPVAPASWDSVCEAALMVRDALAAIGAPTFAKTSGSKGIHIYIPIQRGPLQKKVWGYAKALALDLEAKNPALITAEYRIAKRPPGRILVDYNQNAWGHTLACVYSVRPRALGTVSTPVEWGEIEERVPLEKFTMKSVPARIAAKGDLWKELLSAKGRFDLQPYV